MKHLIAVALMLTTISLYGQENIFPLKSTLWESTVIPVCWENPTKENALGRKLVQQAVSDTWEKYSALEFTKWCPCEEGMKGIRIRVEDDGPHTKGLGNTLDGKKDGMVLNFTFNKWSRACKTSKEFCMKAIAVHEFGHAIGFAHEQNRKDCNFPNCLGKEQGTDGDWYISACDTNSVMNYCNPRYSNNGILSEIDIESVRYIYGNNHDKVSNLFEYDRQDLKLVHTAHQFVRPRKRSGNFFARPQKIRNSLTHEIKIYLSGSEHQLDDVEKVIYKLHQTFENPTVIVTDRSSHFGLGIRVWGQFELYATVVKKNGETLDLNRYLSF